MRARDVIGSVAIIGWGAVAVLSLVGRQSAPPPKYDIKNVVQEGEGVSCKLLAGLVVAGLNDEGVKASISGEVTYDADKQAYHVPIKTYTSIGRTTVFELAQYLRISPECVSVEKHPESAVRAVVVVRVASTLQPLQV